MKQLSRLLVFTTASTVGAGAAFGATLVTGLLVEAIVGEATVSYEMGSLLAMFLAALLGAVVSPLGAWLARSGSSRSRRVTQSLKVLAAAGLGGIISGTFYFTVIAPRATVPPRHVQWVGLITIVGVAVAGTVGALVGICFPPMRSPGDQCDVV